MWQYVLGALLVYVVSVPTFGRWLAKQRLLAWLDLLDHLKSYRVECDSFESRLSMSWVYIFFPNSFHVAFDQYDKLFGILTKERFKRGSGMTDISTKLLNQYFVIASVIWPGLVLLMVSAHMFMGLTLFVKLVFMPVADWVLGLIVSLWKAADLYRHFDRVWQMFGSLRITPRHVYEDIRRSRE